MFYNITIISLIQLRFLNQWLLFGILLQYIFFQNIIILLFLLFFELSPTLLIFLFVVKLWENTLDSGEYDNHRGTSVVTPENVTLEVVNITEETHDDGNILESGHCAGFDSA